MFRTTGSWELSFPKLPMLSINHPNNKQGKAQKNEVTKYPIYYCLYLQKCFETAIQLIFKTPNLRLRQLSKDKQLTTVPRVATGPQKKPKCCSFLCLRIGSNSSFLVNLCLKFFFIIYILFFVAIFLLFAVQKIWGGNNSKFILAGLLRNGGFRFELENWPIDFDC